jgi:hypothetical protein
VNAEQIEAAIQAFQGRVRGAAPPEDMVAIDGKALRRSRGEQLLTAVSVPSLRYVGSAPVPVDKTNEIPVARDLFRRLDLQGRLVGLDALHTQVQTACDLLQEAGADYLFTVKDNQKGLRRTARQLCAAFPAAFSPSAHHPHPILDRGAQPRSARTTPDPHPTRQP